MATRLTEGNCASARAMPITMIEAKISRRTSRRRVSATADRLRPDTASVTFRPRFSSARSTSSASTKAITTVAIAVSSLRWSSTNEAMTRSAAGMAYEATSAAPRVAARARAAVRVGLARARASESFRAALRAFLWSRAAILAVAVFAGLTMGGSGLPAANADRFDAPALTHPLGGFGDVVLSPLARWDAVWYLGIADSGYGDADSPRTAFFPLYPLLARGAGELGGGSRGAVLLAAYGVSLAALLAAMVLLYRLTALELGRRAAAPALLLLCVFPASLFLGAPYAESLFLLCSVGAFYAARTGHWAWAGLAGAAASATRSAGVLLLVPLVVLYLYGPRADRPGETPAPERPAGGSPPCAPSTASGRTRPGCSSPRSGWSPMPAGWPPPTETHSRSPTRRNSG